MSALRRNGLGSSSWKEALAGVCLEMRRERDAVIVCLSGPPSAGKSTLGAEIRRKGLPGIPSRRIAVIDDGVMSINLLGLSLGRIRDRTRKLGLAPFRRWLRGKQVVFFIAIRPWERIERCDVLVQVNCSTSERERRHMIRGKSFSSNQALPPAEWLSSARLMEITTG
jgi:hypothetical protein